MWIRIRNPAGECAPPLVPGGRGHTRERGGEVPIPTGGTYTAVLYINIRTLWVQVFFITPVFSLFRRDSTWTVSTGETGYSSMRSHTSASRRCSELSQASSLGGCGGLRMQSPWDPTAAANSSSRRASDASGARASPVMSHHLSRLHKKAVAAGTTPSSSLVQVKKKKEERTTF
jgi:hypothetical protein